MPWQAISWQALGVGHDIALAGGVGHTPLPREGLPEVAIRVIIGAPLTWNPPFGTRGVAPSFRRTPISERPPLRRQSGGGSSMLPNVSAAWSEASVL